MADRKPPRTVFGVLWGEVVNAEKYNTISKEKVTLKPILTMPDITMCTNEDCPLSYSCWRFNCPPSQYQQSYAKFEPKIDEVLDEIECKMFLETPNSEKSDVVRLFG